MGMAAAAIALASAVFQRGCGPASSRVPHHDAGRPVPAAPAVLGEQASLDAAISRLHAAGATRLAISPCVIGPENDPGELAAACAAAGARRAEALSAHRAISKLVAMRYGAALADRRLAG